MFDTLTVQSYSQAPQLHKRIREALSNRVVWDSVQPSKLVSLTRLNEQQPIERQYYPVSALVSCFFSYYNWTHIWDEKVVRQAIMVGIKNRSFAYVANARKDEQENLVLSGHAPASVQFGKALEKLNDLAAMMDTTVTVFAAAKSGQLFHANTLHNRMVEPMVEESNVIIQEEQVEE